MKFEIPLFKMSSGEDDINAVSKVLRRKSFWAAGPEMDEFEDKLAEYMGTKHAITFNSGTSALHAILLAHDVKGKEVIIPSFTFVSTATSVIMAGGTPIFAESEDKTFGISIESVKNKITEKTKAVIALHYGGTPSREIIELKKLCKEKNLILIEDNAESMGAEINNKKAGTIGDAGMLSFCQNKIITTGEGGAIITNDSEIYHKCKLIRSHGRLEGQEDYFSSIEDNDYISIGYNWRMPTMNAALGISQLKKIDRFISLRREKGKYIKKELEDINKITFPLEEENSKSVFQMFTMVLPEEKTRNNLQKLLQEKRIMSKVYFQPAHLKTIYTKQFNYKKGDLPKTELISQRVITIPFYPDIPYTDLDKIIKAIKEFMNGENK